MNNIELTGDAAALVHKFRAQHIEHLQNVCYQLLENSHKCLNLARGYDDAGFKELGARVHKAAETYQQAAVLLQLLGGFE